MNKDVIYIDIEDDITAIIGKVKAAGNKIVALVPPKRVGVLQSAVNLKLLQRAAGTADKRVVLITNDHSLMALASGLKLPVARNLQSRPEIPTIEAPEEPTEEIINGQELPSADAPATAEEAAIEDAADKSVADEISEKVDLGTAAVKGAEKSKPTVAGVKAGLGSAMAKGKKKLKIPDFDRFRTRLFIFCGLGILFIAFLVWAFVFAPHATVTISAKTTSVNIDRTLTLTPTATLSDPAKLILKPNVQQLKKAVATEFDATGSKEIGNNADGTITVTNCEYTAGFTIAAGTTFTGEDGKKFKSTQSASLPGYAQQSQCSLAKRDIAVEAVTFGPEYNVAAQDYEVAGVSGNVPAQGAAMAGGTKETVTVVSQEDVDKAKQKLTQANESDAKTELKKQFTADDLVVEESFMTEQTAPTSSPAVGEQGAHAKLTVETTYTYVAVSRIDVRAILQAAIDEVLKDKNDQETYTLGENNIAFQTYHKTDTGFSAKLITTGSTGPKIDTDALAKELVGKRFGEIQAITDEIPGVDKVDIVMSPFWVTTAPAADKIDIKFSVAPSNE